MNDGVKVDYFSVVLEAKKRQKTPLKVNYPQLGDILGYIMESSSSISANYLPDNKHPFVISDLLYYELGLE